ncbi:MAG TPA: transglycosylase domain-containing protein, partial [Allosphingosinicella sp.]
KRTIQLLLAALLLLIVWLTFTAPLNRSLQPLGAPSLTVLSAEGEVIARKGAHIGEPVDVTQLPPHVAQAFIAVEDRRFFRHLGVDPYGLGRAMMRNLGAGSMLEGGSTITQQLAKTSFTGADRTAFRKVQEGFIALWLEAWLSKEEILSRYLSNVYFGDNVYGLRAASLHYFSVEPEQLTLEQSAMLAGVVNAPSRLAPTRNLGAARERAGLVIRRMRDAGFLTERQARAVRPARLRVGPRDETPTGTYFTDWVLAEAARGEDEESYGEREVQTTLELPLQQLAERIVRNAGLGRSQAALVAMRTDGRVVAMVGGRNYQQNAFNRATQARRQPGSTFKLFVYLAALRNGWRPDSPVDDSPLTIGNWSPQNYGRQYRGRISLADALAQSSNVATIRIAQQVGLPEVIRAARDLGVTSDLPDNPSMPLGTAGLSLLEMTAAYAAIAADAYPIRPHGLAARQSGGWMGDWAPEPAPAQQRDPAFAALRSLLNGVVTRGTGTAANLDRPTYGKTGTTQDYRDALFIGFADDLVVGVWIGNDDNSPLPGVTGGSAPARIWRSFMTEALGARPAAAVQRPQVVEELPSNAALQAEPLGNELAPADPLAEPADPLAGPDDPTLPRPDQPQAAPPPLTPQREPEPEPEQQPPPPR